MKRWLDINCIRLAVFFLCLAVSATPGIWPLGYIAIGIQVGLVLSPWIERYERHAAAKENVVSGAL